MDTQNQRLLPTELTSDIARQNDAWTELDSLHSAVSTFIPSESVEVGSDEWIYEMSVHTDKDIERAMKDGDYNKDEVIALLARALELANVEVEDYALAAAKIIADRLFVPDRHFETISDAIRDFVKQHDFTKISARSPEFIDQIFVALDPILQRLRKYKNEDEIASMVYFAIQNEVLVAQLIDEIGTKVINMSFAPSGIEGQRSETYKSIAELSAF